MKINDIKSINELVDYINDGHHVKYLTFWGHTPSNPSEIDKACFSQWYDSSFTVDGLFYRTAEHYMMAQKAKLFGDNKAFLKILESTNPGAVKSIGREIGGFSEEIWIKHRFEIVVSGNFEKFSQNAKLKEFMVSTGERILVEASPVDKIWGIGLAADNDDVENPNKWKGLNLLGFALMQVRTRLLNM